MANILVELLFFVAAAMGPAGLLALGIGAPGPDHLRAARIALACILCAGLVGAAVFTHVVSLLPAAVALGPFAAAAGLSMLTWSRLGPRWASAGIGVAGLAIAGCLGKAFSTTDYDALG